MDTKSRDVTIHSTHDSIHDLFYFFYKMRFKTNYKLNVSFYYCLDKNAACFFV